MAEHSGREAAVVLHRCRWLTDPHRCRSLDEWKSRETGERLKSCTMIVGEPNDMAAQIHDRMPVFSDGKAIRAVAERGGGSGSTEARADRFPATLARVEAGR